MTPTQLEDSPFLMSVNKPLPGWDRADVLSVTSLRLGQKNPAHPEIVATVMASSKGRARTSWEVIIPVGHEDLDASTCAETLAVTLRANLEEWWHTRLSRIGSTVTARQLPAQQDDLS